MKLYATEYILEVMQTWIEPVHLQKANLFIVQGNDRVREKKKKKNGEDEWKSKDIRENLKK